MHTSSLRFLLFPLFLLALVGGCTAAQGPGPATLPADSAAAPSPMTPPPGWLSYADAQNRYTVHFPEGWVVTSGQDAANTTHFIYLDAADEADRAGISVVVQGPAQELATVAAAANQTIAEQPNVLNLWMTDEQAVEIGGLRGLRQTLRYELAGQAMAQQVVYLGHWRYTFAISLMVTDENLATYAPTFERFVQSFQASAAR